MGGATSKNSIKSATKTVVEAMAKSIQNCKGNTVINQRVAITGNYNVVSGVRLVQGMKLSSACGLESSNIMNTQQAVANAIKQAADSQSVAVMGALGNSNANNLSDILNEVKTKITSETIQNIINNFNATQEFFLNGNNNIVNDISMEQSMQILYDNCLSALTKLDSIQKIENATDQQATSKQTNPIAEIVDSVGNVVAEIGSIFTGFGWMWVIVAIIAMVVFGWVMINGGPAGMILKNLNPFSSNGETEYVPEDLQRQQQYQQQYPPPPPPQ